jgi:lipoprotein NlpI
VVKGSRMNILNRTLWFTSILVLLLSCASVAESPEVLWDRGHKKMESGDYMGATQDFTEVIKAYPLRYNPYLARGIAYYDLGSYERALADFESGLQKKPDAEGLLKLHFNLGATRENLGDFKGAVADYASALQQPLNPEQRGVLLSYQARALCHLEDLSGALSNLNKVLELDPDDEDAYASRALVYYGLDRLPEALVDYEKVSKLVPEDPWPMLFLWLIRANQGELEQATADLREFSNDSQSGKRDWGNAILDCLANTTTEEELLAQAEKLRGIEKPQNICEAHFFLGLKNKFDGNEERAKFFFQQAADSGVLTVETWLATYELSRL